MHSPAEKATKTQSPALTPEKTVHQLTGKNTFGFEDQRAETLQYKKISEIANSGHGAMQLKAFQSLANNYTAHQQPIQMVSGVIQLVAENLDPGSGAVVIKPGPPPTIRKEIIFTKSSQHRHKLMS